AVYVSHGVRVWWRLNTVVFERDRKTVQARDALLQNAATRWPATKTSVRQKLQYRRPVVGLVVRWARRFVLLLGTVAWKCTPVGMSVARTRVYPIFQSNWCWCHRLVADLSIPAQDPFGGSQLFQPHRAAGMQFLG